jgi:hypothetical protein
MNKSHLKKILDVWIRYKPIISSLTPSDWIILWVYFLVAPAIILGLSTKLVVPYLRLYFVFSVIVLVLLLIKYVLNTFLYHLRKVSHKLSFENFLIAFAVALMTILVVLLITYSPLLPIWDAISIYIPIAESIVKTGSLHGPNIYYQSYQTMYSAPLVPLIISFFLANIGVNSFRLVPILFTIILFFILIDFYRIFTNDAIYLAIVSFFIIITNPFYILYFLKDSLLLDLAFITMTWAMIYELSKIIMFKEKSKPFSFILWSIAGTLSMISKEYGVFLFFLSFLLLSPLILKTKSLLFSKYFLSVYLMLPFLGIYVWSISQLGLRIGVLSQILGSGFLLLMTYLFYFVYLKLIQKFFYENIMSKLSLIKILTIILCISTPAILYYIIFAINYGVIGFINLTWMQEKFVPEKILAIITSLQLGQLHIMDIISSQYFNYQGIILNIGTFIIFTASYLLLPFIIYYRKKDLANQFFLNSGKILLLVLLITLMYYLASVDMLNSLVIVGNEYRRSLLVISFFSVLIPVTIQIFCERVAISKLVPLWVLFNVMLHIIIINPLRLPYSYLELLNRQKTTVPEIYLITVLILGILLLLPQLLKLNIKFFKYFYFHLFYRLYKSYIFHSRALTKTIILIFTFFILISQVTFISRNTWDPQWYNRIYSIEAFYPTWGTQWIKAYELLENQSNSIILLEGSYPLAYFLNRSVIVYGNPYSLFFTANGLLMNVLNASSATTVYVVRNMELIHLKGLFDVIISELNSTHKLKAISIIYKGKSLEIYKLEINEHSKD